MEKLEQEITRLKDHFDEIEHEREEAYGLMRELRRMSTKLVRDIQRGRADDYETIIAECRTLSVKLSSGKHQFGFVEEAMMEYSEAALFHAFMNGLPAPTQADLGCTERSYLLGLADAISEIRRRVLVLMRNDSPEAAAQMFDLMERLFALLMTFDHTEAVLPLRRKQDAVRAVLERTRADVTTYLCQKRLEDKLSKASG